MAEAIDASIDETAIFAAHTNLPVLDFQTWQVCRIPPGPGTRHGHSSNIRLSPRFLFPWRVVIRVMVMIRVSVRVVVKVRVRITHQSPNSQWAKMRGA